MMIEQKLTKELTKNIPRQLDQTKQVRKFRQMNGFKFLYWDDYEAPKGDNTGESSSTADSPEDDSTQSRSGKDDLQT